jgi:hypothetical protein
MSPQSVLHSAKRSISTVAFTTSSAVSQSLNEVRGLDYKTSPHVFDGAYERIRDIVFDNMDKMIGVMEGINSHAQAYDAKEMIPLIKKLEHISDAMYRVTAIEAAELKQLTDAPEISRLKSVIAELNEEIVAERKGHEDHKSSDLSM